MKSRYLKVILMGKLFFVVSMAIVVAAVGTVGSNGQVPYLTMSSKYVGDTITVELHDAPADHGEILYLCSLSDGFIDCTDIVGPGGQVLDDGYVLVVATSEESFQVLPRDGMIGQQVYVQAIIRDKGAPTPTGVEYTLSRPYSITLTEKVDTAALDVKFEGLVPHAGELHDMTSYGGLIYCASEQFGLVRLAPNASGSPLWSGGMKGGKLSFAPSNVSVGSGRAVLAGGNDFLSVVDISSTTADPVFMTEVTFPGYDFFNGVIHSTTSGTYAFMNAYKDGVAVVDVTSSTSLSIVDQFMTNEWVKDIQVFDGYLYVLTGSMRGYVYELNNSTQPVQVASFSVPAMPASVSFQGDNALVLSQIGTEVYVYSLPSAYNGATAPQLLNTEAVEGSAWFNGLVVNGDYAYLYNKNTVQPCLIGTDGGLTFSSPIYLSQEVTDLCIDGGWIHVSKAGAGRGVETVNAGTNQSLPDPDYALTYRYLRDMAVLDAEVGDSSGRFCYVLERDVGLRVVNVTDPTCPAMTHTMEGDYLALAAYGDKLITSESPNIIRIRSIYSAEGHLETLAEVECGHRGLSLEVEGDFLYVGDCLEGLTIFDIEDVENPEHLSSYKDDDMGPVLNATVCGYFAYLNSPYGTTVLDISDRKNPELLQSLTGFGDNCSNCQSDGFNLLLPNLLDGLEVFDVSAPYSMDKVFFSNSFVLPNYAADVAIHGNVAVVTMTYGGHLYWKKDVYFYDITDPGQVNCFKILNNMPGFNGAVTIKDDLVYLTDEESLVDILSLK